MTLSEFSNVFGVLALQLRCTDADEAMVRAYYKALEHVDLELVQMAAKRFAMMPGDNHAWFPKTAEWLETVEVIVTQRAEELRGRLRARREPLCLECSDTGWAYVSGGVKRCACQDLRRLEIIGRRPMPALPEAR